MGAFCVLGFAPIFSQLLTHYEKSRYSAAEARLREGIWQPLAHE
jgi:hypothetical protein